MKRWLVTLITVASASVISLQAQTYCTTGLYTDGCAQYADYLDNVIIGTFSKTATGCSVNNYSNYTSDTITVSQTDPTLVSITAGASNNYFAIWIDANNDGDFADAGEFIWNSTVGASSATGSLLIPTTIGLGNHRLRVRCHYGGSAWTALESCASYTWGETEDYTIKVTAPPACPTPYTLSTSGITAYTANLHWASTGTAFSIEYGLLGFTPGSGTIVTSSVDSIALTGLSAATFYEFRVQNNCSGSNNGLSNWSAMATFVTECAPISFPKTENFDLTAQYGVPQCWTLLKSVGHTGNGRTDTWPTPLSAPHSWGFSNNGNTTDTLLLISPNMIGLDSSNKQVTFWAETSTSSYNSDCVVGTMSDPTDISSFHAVATITAGQNWSEFTVQFDSANGYNGTDHYVAFMYKSAISYRYLYIDNISLEDIPACPKPLFVTLSGVTSSTTTVSWTSAGSDFNLAWGLTGFTQGTGVSATATATSYTMTGLLPNTTYDVYIQNDCIGGGNGLSVWQGPYTFTTECLPFVGTLTENFDLVTPGSSSNPTKPDCWKYITTKHGGYGFGYTRQSTSLARSGDKLFFINAGNITDTAALVTPAIAGMDTADKHITFWARSEYTWNDEHIMVGTLSDPNDLSTMTTIDTVLIQGTVYKYFDVYLDAANGYNGVDQHIVLATWNGTGWGGGYVIDDITVSDVPSCTPSSALATSNVTNSTASLSWIAGDGLAYNIEYGPTGFTQGTGAPLVMGITATSYMLTSLAGNTSYDVYVRDSCSSAMSPWFGPITFTTSCDPIATPILEDFETTIAGGWGNPSPPTCWSFYIEPQSTSVGYTNDGSWNNPKGTKQWYFSNYSLDTLALISPAVAGITNGDKMVKFYAKSNSITYANAVIIGTSSSAVDLNNITILDTVITDTQNYFTEFKVYLDSASGYNGTDQYVFFMTSDVYSELYLDDISIVDIPTCGAPWNLASSAITTSGATVSWSNLYGTGFQIEYGPQGFTQGTGLGTTVNNVTSPYSITGLTPNTFYDVYVSDMCDTTIQEGPLTFKTECVGQLSGVYTVGGTPGASNFATLDSAMSVLTGCGVSSAVTFNLQGGTYAMAISMAEIQGASATNTVTINGSGVGFDTISIPAGVINGIDFNGTSYVTFKNMTIQTSGDRLIWFHNDANNITFENCDLIGQSQTVSNFTSAVITATAEATSNNSQGMNAHAITISGCTITGGYYGIAIEGASTTNKSSGFLFEDNTITGAYNAGIRMNNTSEVEILSNEVIMSSQNQYSNGIRVDNTNNFKVNGNSVFAGAYGLNMYQGNNVAPTNRSEVINNFLVATSTYGLYLSSTKYLNVFNNSIKGTTRGMTVFSANEMDFRNNIFQSSTQHALYVDFGTSATNLVIDYNIYDAGGSSVAYWGSATYATLAAWQTAVSTQNANSLVGNPGFLSATDLHIVGVLPNDVGDNSVPVVIDIDGDARPATGSTTKDIGADEFTPLNWDASLEALFVPLVGCGDSTTEVSVVVKNYGLNSITSLPITVNLTGGLTNTLSLTATVSIAQGTADTISVGTFNTYAGAAGVNFAASVALVGDQKPANDTKTAGPGNYVPVEPVTHGMIDTVCSSVDSLDLWAYHVPGTKYSWYDAAIGGNKVASLTDTITVATSGMNTYYVAYDSTTANPSFGTGLLTTSGQVETPYSTSWMDGRHQYLVLASELAAMGIVGGGEINSLAFNVDYAATGALNDLTIKMVGTSVSALTSSYQPTTGMTVVYNANYTTVGGWNVHTFTTPFIWNGVDNVLIEVCFDNNAWSGNSTVKYTSTAFPSVTGGWADLNSSSGCTPGGITNQQMSNNRPDMQFNMKTIACSEIRKPVSFNVVQDTVYAAFTTTLQANGADVNFDGSMSLGHTYDWDFGDGAFGTGITTMHTYAAGTYVACLTVTDTTCGITIDTMCSTVVATIGLEENLLNQTLNVFPNPSNGNFRVEFQVEGLKNVELRVTTLLGQTIYVNKPGNVSGDYREDIDLSNEASGVYIIQIITDDNFVSRKITLRK
jgi:hypothetical protein